MKSTMKKLLSLVTVVVLLMSAVPFVAPQTQAADIAPQFQVNSVVVKNGSTFYLNLIAENLVNVQGGTVFLSFDKNAFEFVRSTETAEANYPNGLSVDTDLTYDGNRIACVFIHESSFSTGTLLLAQLEFKTLNPQLGNAYEIGVTVDHLYVGSGKGTNVADQISVAPALVTAEEYASAQNLFTYTKTDESVTVTGYTGSAQYVEIPAKIDDLPVTGIANWAFANKSVLRQLIIPSSVTQIEQNAFTGSSNLERLDISRTESVAVRYLSDADGVLYEWNSTGETLSLFLYPPASKLGFFHTGDLASLPINAFNGSKYLKLIILGETMAKIESGALSNLPSLANIFVDNANSNYTAVDGVLFNKSKTELVRYPAAKTATVFNVDGTLADVQSTAFDGVMALKEIKVASTNKRLTASNGVLIKDAKIIVFYPGAKTEASYTIPSAITTIADFAFSTAANLKTLNMNRNIRSLGFGEHFNYLTVPSGLTVRPKGSWMIRVYAGSGADDYVKSQASSLAYEYYGATMDLPSVSLSIFSSSEDISVRVNSNGHVFKNVSAPVTAEDYSFSNDTLVIKKAYLDSLKKSENVGKGFVWTLNFETGSSVDFTIYFTDDGAGMTGDVDGDKKITASDARLALRASASLMVLTSAQKAVADVDRDGKITASDARTILRVSVGLQSFAK